MDYGGIFQEIDDFCNNNLTGEDTGSLEINRGGQSGSVRSQSSQVEDANI